MFAWASALMLGFGGCVAVGKDSGVPSDSESSVASAGMDDDSDLSSTTTAEDSVASDVSSSSSDEASSASDSSVVDDTDAGDGCSPGSCAAHEYCKFEPGNCEGAGSGACVERPEGCDPIYDPQCGCDGLTHGNACEAAAVGVNLQSAGVCPGDGTQCASLDEAACRTDPACMVVDAAPIVPAGDWMCIVVEETEFFGCERARDCDDAETTWVDDTGAYWWTADSCGPESFEAVDIDADTKICPSDPCRGISTYECDFVDGCGLLRATRYDVDAGCRIEEVDFGCITVVGFCGGAAMGYYMSPEGERWNTGPCRLPEWSEFQPTELDSEAAWGPLCDDEGPLPR